MYLPAGHRDRWCHRPCDPPEQVFNADQPTVALSPASEAPAEAIRAGWAALLPGQDVPLIGEAVLDGGDPRFDG